MAAAVERAFTEGHHLLVEAGTGVGKSFAYLLPAIDFAVRYKKRFWQAAKRRMQSGTILVVNHALFFSDLALRMAGVNYLPKYELAILDEAHTVEDVAGQHFGLKVGEAAIRYVLRSLYDPKR